MPDQQISTYQRGITDHLCCSAEDAAMVEDIMRNHVFHSTLDWLSEAQFGRGALEAWNLLKSDREMFEGYYREAREAFAKGKSEV